MAGSRFLLFVCLLAVEALSPTLAVERSSSSESSYSGPDVETTYTSNFNGKVLVQGQSYSFAGVIRSDGDRSLISLSQPSILPFDHFVQYCNAFSSVSTGCSNSASEGQTVGMYSSSRSQCEMACYGGCLCPSQSLLDSDSDIETESGTSSSRSQCVCTVGALRVLLEFAVNKGSCSKGGTEWVASVPQDVTTETSSSSDSVIASFCIKDEQFVWIKTTTGNTNISIAFSDWSNSVTSSAFDLPDYCDCSTDADNMFIDPRKHQHEQEAAGSSADPLLLEAIHLLKQL